MSEDYPVLRSLKEECTTYEDIVDEKHGPRTLRKVNWHQYHREIRRRAHKGKPITVPLTKWLIHKFGYADITAQTMAAVAWTLYADSRGDPVGVLRNPDFPWTNYLKARGALNKLATWMITEHTDGEVHDLGRKILSELTALPARGPEIARARRVKIGLTTKIQPLTVEEEGALFDAIERIRARYSTRWPWYWSCLRIVAKTGMRPDDLVHIEFERTERACIAGLRGEPAGVPIWRRRSQAALIPIALILDEIKPLVFGPQPWGTLADLISPRAKEINRHHTATKQLRICLRKTYKEAGLYPEGQNKTAKYHIGKRVQFRALQRMWETSRDWLLLQQMSGMDLMRLKNLSWLRDGTEEEISSD